ncbi:hypothetical protein EYF80_026704 [Liparis tanakae]|uniref:Uncharacterized protein n=1 Tax=Liparis tanakae TaxID=230148 RepID=A0A4Z2HB37_9TELE|nr:hypothetical protein EYF80_026704 [Liparis tanakae]
MEDATRRAQGQERKKLVLLLPGLGLIQTLICDDHDLLEDVTNVLLRLTHVVMFPYVVRISHILVRQSS